jgi:quercetin dioxygenase-like cupin family protein
MNPIVKGKHFDYPGIPVTSYKNEPGTWVDVTRRVLSAGEAAFEARYFEVGANGYTSFEKHQHEHFVVVLTGSGRVRLDGNWFEISDHDVIRIGSGIPHQFHNDRAKPLGFLCVVDRQRDRPILLEDDGTPKVANE